MPDTSISRTLVKSPPELWNEVSDLAALAEHLGEFGEIAITRVVPESTVAWEGETASGTVALEPTGWGTKVTLTATSLDDRAEEALPAEPEPPAPVAEPPARRARRGLGRLAFWRRRPADGEPARPTGSRVAVAPAPEPEPTPFARQATAVLSGTLDALGAAHHRPFSRG